MNGGRRPTREPKIFTHMIFRFRNKRSNKMNGREKCASIFVIY